MASLALTDIRKRLGGMEILKGVDIELGDGDFLVLLGPSGCGKSTLLNLIAGLDTIDQGEIRIGERSVNNVHPKDRDIAMVFQSYALYPSMTVEKNISFGLERRGVPKAEREEAIAAAAKLLQIEPLLQRKPAHLSGGQRQRVAMGRALVRNPKVFLFDEPLSNLDAKLRGEMRTEIKRLHQRLGATIVYVTHDQVEAMTLATRVAVMRDGVIQQYADPQTTYEKPANMFVAGFIGSPAMNFIPGTIIKNVDGDICVCIEDGSDRSKKVNLPIFEPESQYEDWIGREVVFGVRPEAITNANSVELGDESGLCSFDATVDVVEPMGADTMVVIKLGGKEVVARVSPKSAVPAGQQMKLAVKMAEISLFDPKSTNRI